MIDFKALASFVHRNTFFVQTFWVLPTGALGGELWFCKDNRKNHAANPNAWFAQVYFELQSILNRQKIVHKNVTFCVHAWAFPLVGAFLTFLGGLGGL